MKDNKTTAFIGVAMIMAAAMSREEAYANGLLKEKDKPSTPETAAEEGYFMDYGDYQSWCPKEVFDAKYFPLADKTKISREDVEGFMVKGTGYKLGEKTCVVLDTTITGFDTVGTSACVDPNNYNQEIGEEIARRDITSYMWGHLGFVLQWAKNGLTRK